MAEKPKIIVAIPSYNEADTIGPLTQIIDQGLGQYFGHTKGYIVNADNNSPDGTKEAFLNTATKAEKVYLPEGELGKGRNFQNVFKYAQDINAAAVAFIDGDVASADPLWIKKLIEPVLDQGYDHILPVYLRNEYDGSITNHLAYPVVYGLLLTDLRQPLAGEIGLSARAIKTFLEQNWPASANYFGIDIFLVTESIFHNLKIGQTFLGAKQHKPSYPKLDNMFRQVADALIRQLVRYQNLWNKSDWEGVNVVKLNGQTQNVHSPELNFDYKSAQEKLLGQLGILQMQIGSFFDESLAKQIQQALRSGADNGRYISKDLWVKIVYAIIARGRALDEHELSLFFLLYWARFLTFYQEVLNKTHEQAEQELMDQARLFRTNRPRLNLG